MRKSPTRSERPHVGTCPFDRQRDGHGYNSGEKFSDLSYSYTRLMYKKTI
jgi:hypothetical protein